MRTASVRAALAGVLVLVLVGSCRQSTEIVLDLTTDLPCAPASDAGETTIAIADRLEDIAGPATTTATCRASTRGHLGTLVLVPSGDDNASVAIQIVANPSGAACDPNGDIRACVVAKRVVRFLPHESLTLPIALSRACVGVSCGNKTCFAGACVDPATDPATCAGIGCEPAEGGAGGAGDATEPVDVQAPGDARFDAIALDGANDAGDTGACTIPAGGRGPTEGVDCSSPTTGLVVCAKGTHCCYPGECASAAVDCPLTKDAWECDEPGDCPVAGQHCCVQPGVNTYTTTCSSTPCPATSAELCKTSCDCPTCAIATKCGFQTCGGACP